MSLEELLVCTMNGEFMSSIKTYIFCLEFILYIFTCLDLEAHWEGPEYDSNLDPEYKSS